MGPGNFKPDQQQNDENLTPEQKWRKAIQKDLDDAELHRRRGDTKAADASFKKASDKEQQLREFKENAEVITAAENDALMSDEESLNELIEQAHKDVHNAEYIYERTKRSYFLTPALDKKRDLDKPEDEKTEEEKKEDKHLEELKRAQELAEIRHETLIRMREERP